MKDIRVLANWDRAWCMKITLAGRIQSGKMDASCWLQRFHAPYCRKTGMNLFPGSLNLQLECGFDWYAKQYQPRILWFGREEYGGGRDVLLLPAFCRNSMPGRHSCGRPRRRRKIGRIKI
jgi:hypothetical protein